MTTSHFATTHWSVVVAAAGTQGEEKDAALTVLCETYWYPIYAYARRCGSAAEDARDLTQGFFARLLEKNGLSGADASRGRFRAYLLGAFRHFLSDERDRARALKRGGDRLVLDGEYAEQRFITEPGDSDPEKAFERSWARTLLETVVERLRSEYEGGAKAEVFDCLKPALSGELERSYRELAQEIGTTEGALKVAVHRVRRRFGELLRREIAHTLSDTDEVEEEIRGLFDALA